MAHDLKSYVDKFILNLSAPVNIEDDGNDDSCAIVSSRVTGLEGLAGANVEVARASKLRIKNSLLLEDRDPRYKGKKITRKLLKYQNEVSYKPEIVKYLGLEDNEAKANGDKCEDDFIKLGEELEEYNDSEGEEIEGEGIESDNHKDEGEDDGDIYKEGQDDDDVINEGDRNDENDYIDKDDDDVSAQTSSARKTSTVMTIRKDDNELKLKGIAVRNQYVIYDALFGARIGLQKLMTASNQLPQSETYHLFLDLNDSNYKKNLHDARKAVKKLIEDLLLIQGILLARDIETGNILVSEGYPVENCNANVTNGGDDPTEERPRKKRRKVEEYEELLRKRHKAMIPYRDRVLNTWQSKANLLVNRNVLDFSNFEISAVKQINNILANKGQLIQRTQLRSLTRGNVFSILGKPEERKEESLLDNYDPEIFDDSDFYARMLEDTLKSKMALSSDMIDVSRKWLEIQNLRRKAKKKVDTRASKGRKIRFEVMSKLQQFLAPCKSPRMDDNSINVLFNSMFGS